MADPKATYYGPGERGLATLLPDSGFGDLARMAAARSARYNKARDAAEAKKAAARDRKVNAIYSELAKPVTTAQFYQEEVSKKKNQLVDDTTADDLAGEDPSVMRQKVYSGMQDIVAYAVNGEEVYKQIDAVKTINKERGNVYRTELLIPDMVNSQLLDEDGNIRHPKDVDRSKLTVDHQVYGDGKGLGAKYIIEGVALNNFLKSEAAKHAWNEIDTKIRDGELDSSQFIGMKAKLDRYKLRPFAQFNTLNGMVEVQDADALVKSGFLQVMLNDRDMATLIEGKVEEMIKDAPEDIRMGVPGFGFSTEIPLRDNLRAIAAKHILQGSQMGGAEIIREEKESYQNRPDFYKASATERRDAEYDQGYELMLTDAFSGDPDKVREVGLFHAKQLTKGEDAKTGLQELYGLERDDTFKDIVRGNKDVAEFLGIPQNVRDKAAEKLNDRLYVKYEDFRGNTKYMEYDPRVFTTQLGKSVYKEIAKTITRGYGGNANLSRETTTRTTEKERQKIDY